MKKTVSTLIIIMLLLSILKSQDTSNIKTPDKNSFKRGFGIFPFPNKSMIGYRSNLNKKWAFDSKLGYTFTAVPMLNIELNLMRRHLRNEVFNFYNGLGVTLDGLTPGIIFPVGFELTPFHNYPNIVIVTEASPKITFSFSSTIYSTLSGNIGIIYFKPKKTK